MLDSFASYFIDTAMPDGMFSKAVENYIQMQDYLTRHFILDEHWCWFYDFYSLDYLVSAIGDSFVPLCEYWIMPPIIEQVIAINR